MRKSVILKITSGKNVPRDWQWQIDNIKRITPVAGTEEQYNAFVTAIAERLKQQARFEEACDLLEKHGTDESRELMRTEGRKLDSKLASEMGYLDRWRRACAHTDDLPTASSDDLRAVIETIITESREELDFTKSDSALATAIKNAINGEAFEESIHIPLCAEHVL
jgi:hypothetical protein